MLHVFKRVVNSEMKIQLNCVEKKLRLSHSKRLNMPIPSIIEMSKNRKPDRIFQKVDPVFGFCYKSKFGTVFSVPHSTSCMIPIVYSRAVSIYEYSSSLNIQVDNQ